MNKIDRQDLEPLVRLINHHELDYIMHYLSHSVYLLHYLPEGVTGDRDKKNVSSLLNDLRESFYEIDTCLKAKE